MKKIIPVILCGGSGTRLWPLSRKGKPKQFLSLLGNTSLYQETLRRALRVTGAGPSEIVTVTLESMLQDATVQARSIAPDLNTRIVIEPEGRNTAASVALAAFYVRKHFGDEAMMLVLPADHHITDETAYKAALEAAIPAVVSGFLVTFGIAPTRPETGYGYIRVGGATPYAGVLCIAQFTEKPERDVARGYINTGNYLWNSGMFLFTAEAVIQKFLTHAPVTAELVQKAFSGAPQFYRSVTKESFDVAIIEKAADIAVVPCDIGWSDIGSWRGLLEAIYFRIKKRLNALPKNLLSGRFSAFLPQSWL